MIQTAEDRIITLKSDNKGEGPCPVCHRLRKENGCWSWWKTQLETNSNWQGSLTVICKGFPKDRVQLSEALNRYHVRPPSKGDGVDT